jgi:hypothetical protein
MGNCSVPLRRAGTYWYAAASELPPDWDGSLPESHYLRSDSLILHEGLRLPDVSHRYVVLRSAQGQVLAQAAFQILRLQPGHLSRDSAPTWQYRLWSTYTRIAHPKLLVAGHLFRHDVQTFHYNAMLPEYEAFRWYSRALKDLGRKCGVQAVLVKEPPQAIVPLFLRHAPEFLLLRNDSSMQMAIPEEWQDIRDYEKALKHKYAQRFRKLRGAMKGIEIRELDAEDVNRNANAIFALYQQVSGTQKVRVGLLNHAFLPGLKAGYGDHLRIWGFYAGGELVAFASAWIHPDRFDMFYIGFDYAKNAELQLYFNILFFAVEQAIKFRAPKLILGRTALEAKARVGCRPEYLNTFLYVTNPLLRNLVHRMQGRLSESGGDWEQRHPWKNLPIGQEASANAH